jgi:hypothetical protein
MLFEDPTKVMMMSWKISARIVRTHFSIHVQMVQNDEHHAMIITIITDFSR